MKKIIAVMALLLISSAMTMTVCWSDDQYSDEDLRVFEGRVVNADIGNSTLTVSGAVQMVFPITSDTALKKDIYDIKLSDINKNDYVTVQYYRNGSESRSPSKVIAVTVEYGPGT